VLKKNRPFLGLLRNILNVKIVSQKGYIQSVKVMRKKFENLLLKNTLSIAIPAMAVFVVLIFMFMNYPVLDQIKCNEIGNIEDLDERLEVMSDHDMTNVTYTAKELKYTGFDYVVDKKIKGAYYYSVVDDRLHVFLIKTENPKASYTDFEVKGKIIKDTVSLGHILNQLATENNLEYTTLEKYCCSYMISEPDYPNAYIAMVYIFFASPIIICVLIIIYTIMMWANPGMHPQTKQLEAYGEINSIINEINEQLNNKLIFKKKNIYITSDYMVVNYLTKTDVIKLDYIKYLSKNIVENKFYSFLKKEVYRLTMSNPEKLFYEVDFTDEGLIDDIVTYIRGVNA